MVDPGGRADGKTVPLAAADFFADDQEEVSVPPFPACRTGLQTIVIGKDDEIDPGGLCSVENFGNTARAVGVGGVDMNRTAVFKQMLGYQERGPG